MAIVFQCTCGQAFQVNDDLAGKQAQCHQCKQLLIIPQPGSVSQPQTAQLHNSQPNQQPPANPQVNPSAIDPLAPISQPMQQPSFTPMQQQPNYQQPNYQQPNYQQPNYHQQNTNPFGAPLATPQANLDPLASVTQQAPSTNPLSSSFGSPATGADGFDDFNSPTKSTIYQHPKSKKKKLSAPGGTAGTIMGAVLLTGLLIVMGMGIYSGINGGMSSLFGFGSGPPSFTKSDWGQRRVGSLSLQAPCHFTSGTDIAGAIPGANRSAVSVMEYRGSWLPRSFTVAVVEIRNSDGITGTIDSLILQSISQAARKSNDKHYDYTTEKCDLSGVPARKVKYEAVKQPNPRYARLLVAMERTRCWMVIVEFTHETSAPFADRIIDSVSLR